MMNVDGSGKAGADFSFGIARRSRNGGRNLQSHRAPLAVTLLDAGIHLDSALCSALADRSTLRDSTVENFIRAESDLYMSAVALKEDGFGKFEHHRELSPIDAQNIIRQNRDTLYSAAVFDLDAGPVTITLPNAGKRFMSLQVINEDMYSPPAIYAPVKRAYTRKEVGTRYMLAGVRTLVDPNDPADVKQVHTLQDTLKVEQKSPGKFEMPKWDPVSQKKVREALIVLATTLTGTSRSFGLKNEVDPIQHLVRRPRPGAAIREKTRSISL
jgi:hypothetical protein